MADPRRSKKSDKAGRRGAKPCPSPPEAEDESIDTPEPDISPTDQIESLEIERDVLLDRYQRLAAEFDNYRKRQSRDFKRLIEQGRRKLIEELLTVVDNFDRAKTICREDHSDKDVVDGIMQTSEQLQDVLKKEGLEEVSTEPGDPFNPNIHEAMVAENIDEGDVDIVIEVFQKGYYFGDDLLRPARVKVGKVTPGNGVDVN